MLFAAAVLYRASMRNGSLEIYSVPTGRLCALTWSDVLQPCNTSLTLLLSRFGLSRASEDLFLSWTDLPGYASPRNYTFMGPCSTRTIIHVGNGGTTFGLDDGHVYAIQPKDRTKPGSFAAEHDWRSGKIIQVCVVEVSGYYKLLMLKGETGEAYAFALR